MPSNALRLVENRITARERMSRESGNGHPITGQIDLRRREKRWRIVGTDVLEIPFNAQPGRIKLFHQIMMAHRFRMIVETGTYHGATTVFMANKSGLPVCTIEADQGAYEIAAKRIRGYKNIQSYLGDSVSTLDHLIDEGDIPDHDVFYYLDAHWEERLPLADELTVVTGRSRDYVILIDDFQVADDPGYGFDDYGPEMALNLQFLRPFVGVGLSVFYPTLKSSEEYGARRGCIVLTASSDIGAALQKVPGLRAMGSLKQALARFQ